MLFSSVDIICTNWEYLSQYFLFHIKTFLGWLDEDSEISFVPPPLNDTELCSLEEQFFKGNVFWYSAAPQGPISSSGARFKLRGPIVAQGPSTNSFCSKFWYGQSKKIFHWNWQIERVWGSKLIFFDQLMKAVARIGSNKRRHHPALLFSFVRNYIYCN